MTWSISMHKPGKAEAMEEIDKEQAGNSHFPAEHAAMLKVLVNSAPEGVAVGVSGSGHTFSGESSGSSFNASVSYVAPAKAVEAPAEKAPE